MNKLEISPERPANPARTVSQLYVEFLKHFYDRRDDVKAGAIALQLQDVLDEAPDIAESIRGEEIRSLLAEFHENYHEAIHAREAEIRKILQLHALAANTQSWKTVARQYDCVDLSDRLDLLATLYDRHGDTARAIATLRESQQYCAANRIPFDGQDLLDELLESRHGASSNGAAKKRKLARSSR